MRRDSFEVADIFRKVEIGGNSRVKLSPDQYRVYQAITACRTSKLGAHINRCTECGYQEQSYNSCWNRHCPKCQGGLAFQWTSERMKELLPVPYFHIVFTLPKELREICYQNKRVLFELLNHASYGTLLKVGRNNLELSLGGLSVLHTWNQRMLFHPHQHHIIPAGGFNITTKKWESTARHKKFLLPVRVLSKVFRGKFIAGLKDLYYKKKLYLSGKLSHLNNPVDFEHLISRSASSDWVVYAKRPFAGPKTVLKYLSSYTHRVAISNRRLIKIDYRTSSFSARVKGKPGRKKIVTLPHEVFLKCFMLHTLPKGFRRIRYYGFLSQRLKNDSISRILTSCQADLCEVSSERHPQTCPRCHIGVLKLHILFKPHRELKQHWFPIRPVLEIPDYFCHNPPSSLYSS